MVEYQWPAGPLPFFHEGNFLSFENGEHVYPLPCPSQYAKSKNDGIIKLGVIGRRCPKLQCSTDACSDWHKNGAGGNYT